MTNTPARSLPPEAKVARAEAKDLPVVFVYGTLKRGNRNAGRMAGSVFLGNAATPPRFALYCLGYAPGMVTGGDTSVRGECYIVTPETLAILDAFEGDPWKYRRTMIPVRLDDGTDLYVWTYILRREWVRTDGGRPVPSGTWTQPEDSGAVALARTLGRRARRSRGGSKADPYGDALAAFLADSGAEDLDEAEALAFGYCPDCGEPYEDGEASCLLCDPMRTREAIERWAMAERDERLR